MFKKIVATILVVLFVFGVVGCDKTPTENGTEGGNFSVVGAPDKLGTGAESAETPLSNTYKLLAVEKKLTIGYIGGSITYGASASQICGGEKGDINLSYVNRISNWFKETYPGTNIETVNAGVSDTATNFGLFRIKKNLMNENGHDMPDLVFIEYTTNDSTSLKKDKLTLQIESLIHTVWDANPYAEIVFISTQVAYKNESIKAYKEVGKKYNIPFIDVGSPLRKAKHEKWGSTKETSGKYYYTVDDLHPSHIGYGVYFDAIKPVLEENLNVEIKEWSLFDYKTNAPTAINGNLIDNPEIITADKLTFSGSAEVADKAVRVNLYGTSLSVKGENVTDNSLKVTGKATITAEFSGIAFGMLLDIQDGKEIPMQYKIDDGQWIKSTIGGTYAHPQGFIMEQALEDKEHKVTIEFLDGANTVLGGLFVEGK